MRKIVLFPLFMLLLVAFMGSSPSTDREDYAYNGSTYLVDTLLGIENEGLDGTTYSSGDRPDEHGWSVDPTCPSSGGSAGICEYRQYGSEWVINLTSQSSDDIGLSYNPPDNASFTGIIGMQMFDDGDLSDVRAWPFAFFASGARFGMDTDNAPNADEYTYAFNANCDMNTITRSVGWHNFTLWYETGHIVGYIDDVACHNWTGTSGLTSFQVLIQGGGGNDWNMGLRDFWVSNNHSRPQADTGLLSFDAPTPSNGETNNTFNNVVINASCTGGVNVVHFWNGVLTRNGTSPQDYELNSSLVSSEGEYSYWAYCQNSPSATNSSRTWIYDLSEPSITINEGNSFSVINETVNRYADLLNFNITVADNIDLFGFLVNITNMEGVEQYSYANESIPGTTFNFTNVVNVSSWGNGNFSVNILASDSHTARSISDYDVRKFKNKLEFRTDEGNRISILTQDNAVLNSRKQAVDRYNFEVTFSDEVTKTRVFDIKTEDGKKIYYQKDSPFKGHFVIWNSEKKEGNWVDFEGASGVPIVNRVSDNHYRVLYVDVKGGEKITFNSIGGLNTNEKTFIFEHSSLDVVSVDISPSEASPEDTLKGLCKAVEALSYPVSYDWIWYVNNSIYSNGSSSVLSQNVSVNLANISSSVLSIGANWSFSCRSKSVYNNGTYFTLYQNSSPSIITPVIINTCGVGSAVYPIFNMTYVDDETGLPITLSNGVDLNFYDGINTLTHTKVYSGNSTDALCTNVNPNNRSYSWDMWGILNLQKDNYATRLWVIDESDAYNVSNNPIYELPLSLIPLNDSSTVNYNWFTTAFQPIDGIMFVYKCEQDGSRSLIESSPITDGNALANIELLNTPYSYEIFTGGITYSNNVSYSQCHLESQTEITYYVDVSGSDYGSQIGLYSIDCDVSKNGQDVTVNWSNNPEDASTITGCVLAYRQSVEGQVLVYQNCTSSSNTITRTIPNNTYSYLVKGKLFQSGYSLECSNTALFPQTTTGAESFGATGIIATILLIASLALLYAGEGEASLIGAGLGIIISAILGIMVLPWELALTMVFFLVIIIGVGRVRK